MYKKIKNKFIIIPNYIDSQRIDNFLITKFKDIPKSFIYKILRQGKIKVNKKKVKPKYKIKSQDILYLPLIYIKNIKKNKILPNKQKINFFKKMILFEDKYIIAINKPSGIAVHGGSGINFGIIENFRCLFKKNKFLELVHRIDKETSGILLIAKKRSVLKLLHQQLRENSILKSYVALVKGNYYKNNYGHIKGFLLKKKTNNKIKVIIHNKIGKYSETKFKVIKYYKSMMLLNIIPITGRTHQIRVHMSHIGHPIAYDNRYGDIDFNLNLKKKIGLNRLFLHAQKIKFIHPITNKKICICAPLNNELNNCLLKLNF
ncbi:RluA family pseudouridine synthase [Enterobacteriaceae endosymbiont of Plateumaris consimilis]|uniref:RluA family pseudouridine synthase n=1 Tax=Enterobacteriaceae endosymbiont of Plateumaris consimilis TaxID=2675794 RepID=UPI001448A3F5|nr:RluA family pseudouridine synthase [Enterobacteriaceae endosymbiont of Plateumaris consimilis]QJC28497.1 RluA family pseudouridine synthase [Enterobacteriaceae endosymbiont of Plateumaris consimilis]